MVLVPKTVNQMVAALPRARVLIILLHHGILYDVAFAGGVVSQSCDRRLRERRGWVEFENSTRSMPPSILPLLTHVTPPKKKRFNLAPENRPLQ